MSKEQTQEAATATKRLPEVPTAEDTYAGPRRNLNERVQEVRERRAEELKHRKNQPSPGDPDAKDEHGIPFHRLVRFEPARLAGPQKDGTVKYPLWSGKLKWAPSIPGDLSSEMIPIPHIMCVIVGDHVNNGMGVEFYKKRKGFKEVTEIPEPYREYALPYIEALEKWRAEEKETMELRAKFKAAGIKVPGVNATTTKTVKLYSHG